MIEPIPKYLDLTLLLVAEIGALAELQEKIAEAQYEWVDDVDSELLIDWRPFNYGTRLFFLN